MNLPHRVRITHKITYEVVWIDQFLDGPDTRGECRFDSRQIVICRNQTPRWILRTFIHEVLHAMEHELGIEMKHDSIYKLEEAVERICRLNRWLSAGGVGR